MSACIRPNYMLYGAASVAIDAAGRLTGRLTVRLDVTDIGTGTYTILTQIAADAFGLPADRVTAELGDSDFPENWGSEAPSAQPARPSRSTAPGLKAKMAEAAGVAAGAMAFRDSAAAIAAAPDGLAFSSDCLTEVSGDTGEAGGGGSMEQTGRRPLASRTTEWASAIQRMLLATPVTANQISLLGILFAALGAWALVAAPGTPWLFLVAALFIQLRLLANLMDGLVAVEGGRGSPTGALYNEVPDRLEDALLLAGFGYAAGQLWLGLLAAILAVFTAYVRMLGASHGLPQDFRGPMAKPHRMAALTVGCGLGLVEWLAFDALRSPVIVLAVVVMGTAITGWRRLVTIADAMEARRP